MNAVQEFKASNSSSIKSSFSAKWTHDLLSVASNDRWSDIVVNVKGKEFACHKNILEARSPYFQEKLRIGGHQMKEIVETQGTAEAFDCIRKYIYTGKVDYEYVDEEQLAHIVGLSRKYKLNELTELMTGQMRKRISNENVVKVFQLMSDFKLHAMAEECLELIQTDTSCLNSDQFNDLAMKNVVHLITKTNVSEVTQNALVKKWIKSNPDKSAAKLWNMLDGDIGLDEDSEEEQDDGQRQLKEYLLMNGNDGETVIVDAQTFEEVSRRNLPETRGSAIAVCNGIFYVINTGKGEIICTQVSNLLNGEAIIWKTCAKFWSTTWARGNVAVADHNIYFMSQTRLFRFDTNTKIVEILDERCGRELLTTIYYSLVESNGLIYFSDENRLQSTDGNHRKNSTAMPECFGQPVNSVKMQSGRTSAAPNSLGQLPSCPALINIQDAVCVVGGKSLTNIGLNSVFCYNTKSKSWSTLYPMVDGRFYSATVKLDGRGTLVIGGLASFATENAYIRNRVETSGKFRWLDSALLLDERSSKWIFIPDKAIPYKLEYPQAVTFYA